MKGSGLLDILQIGDHLSKMVRLNKKVQERKQVRLTLQMTLLVWIDKAVELVLKLSLSSKILETIHSLEQIQIKHCQFRQVPKGQIKTHVPFQ